MDHEISGGKPKKQQLELYNNIRSHWKKKNESKARLQSSVRVFLVFFSVARRHHLRPNNNVRNRSHIFFSSGNSLQQRQSDS